MRVLIPFVLLTAVAFGDSMTLRDGRVITGTYLGGDGNVIRFSMGDRIDNAKLEDVLNITFDIRPPAPPPPISAPPPPPSSGGASVTGASVVIAPAVPIVELASGTPLIVRMIDAVDSGKDTVGKTFRASLDEPVLDRNGNLLIPRGADVVVRLIDDQQAGKLAGKTVLTLNLATVMVNGKKVDVNSRNITEQSASKTKSSEKAIGGGAVAGAIIGAVAGGGTGAAIGAGAGAAAGAVVEIASKGPKVHIPSETRLTFKLEQPVRL
jgi:hypothetical protein